MRKPASAAGLMRMAPPAHWRPHARAGLGEVTAAQSCQNPPKPAQGQASGGTRLQPHLVQDAHHPLTSFPQHFTTHAAHEDASSTDTLDSTTDTETFFRISNDFLLPDSPPPDIAVEPLPARASSTNLRQDELMSPDNTPTDTVHVDHHQLLRCASRSFRPTG
ncbi:hypothetical protein BJ508DRAFT_311172 [Ascobolus immersus RN42]|uniref:Uncharacterized protein n=1 Tax=Ascobolus immersus RN42 TaxID=1160509 RepID=A0A3N4HST1_ASCIM|nr:hypothetical protein BJ508DRAFT_311172 [Ascobolus immersus RN42]